jgi:hypothetical protein
VQSATFTVQTKKIKAMKKITLFLMLFVAVAAASFANVPVDKANERVTRSFQSQFSDVSELKWFETTDEFTAVFKQGETLIKARYNKDGTFKASIKYYGPESLPGFVKERLAKRHSAKTVHGVTEINDGSSVEYHVKMKDEKSWYTIRVTDQGTVGVIEKYKRAKESK